jgi:hypothetical protein
MKPWEQQPSVKRRGESWTALQGQRSESSGWKEAHPEEVWGDTHAMELPSFLCGFHPPGVIHIGLALIVLNLKQQALGMRK